VEVRERRLMKLEGGNGQTLWEPLGASERALGIITSHTLQLCFARIILVASAHRAARRGPEWMLNHSSSFSTQSS
jgi:hypothetical protein